MITYFGNMGFLLTGFKYWENAIFEESEKIALTW